MMTTMGEQVLASLPVGAEEELQQEVERDDLSELPLEELRGLKDQCDTLILDALARRQLVTDAIGERKAHEGKPVHVISEEHRVLEAAEVGARKRDLNPQTIVDLWKNLLIDARSRQTTFRKNIGAAALSEGVHSQENLVTV